MATLSILKRASKLPRSFSFSRVSGNPRQLRFEIPGAVGSPWEPENASLVGGVGRYRMTSRHGGFVHVDTRGYSARW